MRKFIHTLLRILDGTPAQYGERQRGQSVIEMAFITPVLIVLVAGIIEVGWFANNYLILLEVARVGARFGAVQEGDNTPLAWERDTVAGGRMSQTVITTLQFTAIRQCDQLANDPNLPGFYNLVACTMLRSMDPLNLKTPSTTPSGNQDDIAISAFSVDVFFAAPGVPGSVPLNQAVIVGRYPSNANRCAGDGERNAFDFFNPGAVDPQEIDSTIPNMSNNRGTTQNQRGFVWFAQHTISDHPACNGSEWTIAEVQAQFNIPDFGAMTTPQLQNLPSQGVVLVEIFWEHNLLLGFPAFSPLVTILGQRTVVTVWAAFPMPALDPRIQFP